MKYSLQSGRSVVEMLGVLAIIGTLSIGGIVGYTYGMNKNKATTILAEANTRAVIVSAQIKLNQQNPVLNEFKIHDFGYGVFDDKVYGGNGTSLWGERDTQFSFQIKSVSKFVCQHLQNSVGGIIQGFSPLECADGVTVVLTYNNDLSTLAQPAPEADCSAYEGTSSNNAGFSAGLAADGITLCKCPIRQKWNADTQVCEDTNDCASYTTQECQEGYYCSFDTSAGCDGCTAAGGGTCTEGIGTCQPLTEGVEVTVKKDGYAGLLTSQTMNWWTANSWCIAHGLKVPSLSEFGCTPDSTKAGGWTCDWSRFKTTGRLHNSNWWVSNDPDCRARNLNVPNSTVDFDTPRKEKWYSTLCTNGTVQEEVFAQEGESCETTRDCASGLFCNTQKKCQMKLDDGVVCPSSEACKSGYCGQQGEAAAVCFTSCTSYSTKECPDGYYCSFNYPEKCTVRGTGACVPIIDGTSLTKETDGVDGLFFAEKMNWWTANALCVAHDKHLASLTEMECNPDPDRDCQNWSRFYKGKLSSSSWWAADLYNSCIGYNVTMGGDRVDHDTGLDNKTYYSVVCSQ